MNEKRQDIRSELSLQLKVWNEAVPKRIVQTKDLSNGGVFLLSEDLSLLPIGTILNVQVQGLPIEAPIKTMEVVRLGFAGLGLRHIDSLV